MKRLLFAVWFLSILSTASLAKETCPLSNGCPIRDGVCIGCLTVKN